MQVITICLLFIVIAKNSTSVTIVYFNQMSKYKNLVQAEVSHQLVQTNTICGQFGTEIGDIICCKHLDFGEKFSILTKCLVIIKSTGAVWKHFVNIIPIH